MDSLWVCGMGDLCSLDTSLRLNNDGLFFWIALANHRFALQ